MKLYIIPQVIKRQKTTGGDLVFTGEPVGICYVYKTKKAAKKNFPAIKENQYIDVEVIESNEVHQ